MLLEVPLAVCLADSGENTADNLAGAAPSWSASLPWNVQIAWNVITRRGDPAWDPFLSSWPEAPALPKDCELVELSLAADRALELQADEACFWLDEQYWALRSVAIENGVEDAAGMTADQFNQAMTFVWSRCLKLSAGSYGVRRLLVPLLDMANHEAKPSALYAFAPGASGGPAIRLHAARPLAAGDPVSKKESLRLCTLLLELTQLEFTTGDHHVRSAHIRALCAVLWLRPPNQSIR